MSAGDKMCIESNTISEGKEKESNGGTGKRLFLQKEKKTTDSVWADPKLRGWIIAASSSSVGTSKFYI